MTWGKGGRGGTMRGKGEKMEIRHYVSFFLVS